MLDQLTPHQYKVWFTDFFNVEVVRIDSIRKMTTHLKNVCPRIGHLCQLAGVRPVDKDGYTRDAIEW